MAYWVDLLRGSSSPAEKTADLRQKEVIKGIAQCVFNKIMVRIINKKQSKLGYWKIKGEGFIWKKRNI